MLSRARHSIGAQHGTSSSAAPFRQTHPTHDAGRADACVQLAAICAPYALPRMHYARVVVGDACARGIVCEDSPAAPAQRIQRRLFGRGAVRLCTRPCVADAPRSELCARRMRLLLARRTLYSMALPNGNPSE